MNQSEINNVYLLGIGGIGMSALARYYHKKKFRVSGYDKTESALTRQLIQEGISVHYADDPQFLQSLIKDSTQVIYTPAIPSDLKEFVYLKEQGFSIKKRAQVLGDISKEYTTIAVSGTHGKTTTCSMITRILRQAGIPVIAFIGGISPDFDSNFIMDDRAQIMIVEADEFDKSFLHLTPDLLIITSMDADHLDVYGSEEQMHRSYQSLIDQVQENGNIVLFEDVKLKFHDLKRDVTTYGKSENANFKLTNLTFEDQKSQFTLLSPSGERKNLTVAMPGIHNALNALASIICARKFNVSWEDCDSALQTYGGVKRRFEFVLKNESITVIDDYAHHPEEIKQLAQSIRAMYPHKKIQAIFQPHLFSRTQDFAQGFGESLSLFDGVWLLPIYPAREKPIPGVTSSVLQPYISCVSEIIEKLELLPRLDQLDADILVTIGAGDIDRLVPEIVSHFKITT